MFLFSRVQQRLTGSSFSQYYRIIATAILVIISFLVIGRIIYSEREVLLTFDWQIRPYWIIASILLFLLDLLIALCAWHILMSRLAHFNNFRINCKHCLYSSLARRIPGTVWYIASRTVLYAQENIPKKTTAFVSTIDLLMFVVSGLITTLLTLPFWLSTVSARFPRIWIVVIISLLLLPIVHPKFLNWVVSKLNQTQVISLTWQDSLYWLSVYILTWVIGGFVLFSVTNIFVLVEFNKIAMFIGLWSISGFISLIGVMTFSVISLREITLVFLLSFSVPVPIALMVGITIRLLWLIGELLTGLMSIRL